jgi:hypothetical protein
MRKEYRLGSDRQCEFRKAGCGVMREPFFSLELAADFVTVERARESVKAASV